MFHVKHPPGGSEYTPLPRPVNMKSPSPRIFHLNPSHLPVESAPMERFTATYSGFVQGVGFRFTARGLASGFLVGGHVRNLPDGTVEVLAEGEPPEVERFLAAIEDRMSGHIRSRNVRREPVQAPAADFRVLI